MKPFIGRKLELEQLENLTNIPGPKIVVIKGRRRIGKSRLAEKFGQNKTFLSLTGLAPTDAVSAQDQRNSFAQQLSLHFNIPPFTFSDWSDGFAHLTQHISKSETVILLDEISWMGSKDPTFVPKLKIWWDKTLQFFPNLILIFCGSVSTWIENNIINSTLFFGRVSLTLDLEELTLYESHQFLKAIGIKASHYDIFKILSILGGVPWYLEQLDPTQTIDTNIKRLCFNKNGLLVKEFDRIFHDLFDQRSSLYKKIIHEIQESPKTLSEIRQGLNYSKGGPFSYYMQDLTTSGFISKHYSWSLKTGKIGKQSLYRLSDSYLRFYIKYIEPNLLKIERNSYQNVAVSDLPGWNAMMGFQVENLILKNRHILLKLLGIRPQDIVADNPYIQKESKASKGCQIDYLIQTQTNNIFVCEFKFKRKTIRSEIIDSMQEKIRKIPFPKGFGICPVLVHLGEVSDTVYNKNYFYRIVDIEDFLEN